MTEDGEQRPQRTSGQFEMEGGYVLEGAGRAAVAARIQLPFFLDLRTRYSLYWEDDAPAPLAIGRTQIDVRIVDAIGIQLQLGLMLLHFQDNQGAEFGAGASFALDLFLISPLVLSFEGSIGFAGEATIPTLRARAGIMVDSTEFYLGYHYESVNAGSTAVDLGGPMIGIRHWL